MVQAASRRSRSGVDPSPLHVGLYWTKLQREISSQYFHTHSFICYLLYNVNTWESRLTAHLKITGTKHIL
jgi:hypothetical protein